MKTEIQRAVEILTEALLNNPDYWMSWQANIAMAVKDQYSMADDKSDIHRIANAGATAFLNLLTYDNTSELDLPGALTLEIENRKALEASR